MSNLAVLSVKDSSLELHELEQLFRGHHKMMYRTAYSLLANAADAEDVSQTIFLRLLRTGINPDLQKNPKGYLYRAAVNQSLSIVRSRKRHPSIDGLEGVDIPNPHLNLGSAEED